MDATWNNIWHITMSGPGFNIALEDRNAQRLMVLVELRWGPNAIYYWVVIYIVLGPGLPYHSRESQSAKGYGIKGFFDPTDAIYV